MSLKERSVHTSGSIGSGQMKSCVAPHWLLAGETLYEEMPEGCSLQNISVFKLEINFHLRKLFYITFSEGITEEFPGKIWNDFEGKLETVYWHFNFALEVCKIQYCKNKHKISKTPLIT